MGNRRCNLVHHRFTKLRKNIAVAAGTSVSKVQNNLLDFIVGVKVDGKCVGIWEPIQQLICSGVNFAFHRDLT